MLSFELQQRQLSKSGALTVVCSKYTLCVCLIAVMYIIITYFTRVSYNVCEYDVSPYIDFMNIIYLFAHVWNVPSACVC